MLFAVFSFAFYSEARHVGGKGLMALFQNMVCPLCSQCGWTHREK